MNVDGTWWIVLTAAETKEKRADERPVAEELTSLIDRYLDTYDHLARVTLLTMRSGSPWMANR